MNKLTAIRTFAAPGFTPTNRVKIFSNRWYMVRFQNIETDPRADYVGLAEGEYVQLLPGSKAREAKTARLNHCNAISEYKGDVFELQTNSYGNPQMRHIGYFPSEQDARNAQDVKQAEHDKWIADCERNARSYRSKAAEVRAGASKSIMTADHHEQCAADCDRVVSKKREAFRAVITHCAIAGRGVDLVYQRYAEVLPINAPVQYRAEYRKVHATAQAGCIGTVLRIEPRDGMVPSAYLDTQGNGVAMIGILADNIEVCPERDGE